MHFDERFKNQMTIGFLILTATNNKISQVLIMLFVFRRRPLGVIKILLLSIAKQPKHINITRKLHTKNAYLLICYFDPRNTK